MSPSKQTTLRRMTNENDKALKHRTTVTTHRTSQRHLTDLHSPGHRAALQLVEHAFQSQKMNTFNQSNPTMELSCQH